MNHSKSRWSLAVLLATTLLSFLPAAAQTAQNLGARGEVLRKLPEPEWDTAANHPNDPRYIALDYMVLFVSNEGHNQNGTSTTAVHLGQDVIASNNPAAHGPGGGLWAVLPGGEVVKIFPLPAHELDPDLIDTPLGKLHKGAVVEPNISEDGKSVYFSWFHDQTWRKYQGGYNFQELSYKGADVYRIDLAPLIADDDFDPQDLAIQRLTFKEYTGPNKADVVQTASSKLEHAINPILANSGASYWGTVDMHMIEMRTKDGLKAVWVSNRSRAANSNTNLLLSNHNFNIYIADIGEEGLGPAKQFQYYTTTSALSPIPLRNGMAFSYQSSTEFYRRWDIQALTSSGVWTPLIGFAHDSTLFHLGSMVTQDVGGGTLEDTFLGVKYYNGNDGGFGQIHKVKMSDAGINQYVPSTTWGWAPLQLSTNLTLDVTADDFPSDQFLANGQLVYAGKLSSPRAGRMGGEWLSSYTPTSANRWIADDDGLTGIFDSRIVYRPDLEPFKPYEPVDLAKGTGVRIVVDDANWLHDQNLLWPTPVLSWQERYGTPQQSFSPSIIDPETLILPGEPFAEVGTSAIYNTDVRPYDCWLDDGESPYNPNDVNENEQNYLAFNFDGLRYVQDQDDLCAYLLPSSVLGIQVNMTSNRVDVGSVSSPGSVTDNGGKKENSEILGVYAPSLENVADQSFNARIPSDVPFDFHLLDAQYGMKLVDVRSWHSLKPREIRTDCGGCHQHEAGFAIPYAGTEASLKPPLDMVTRTKYVAYDPDCKPTIQEALVPTRKVPEWTQDIWPGFDQHCGSCHNANVSTDALALTALDYTDESNAYSRIMSRNYASSIMGALGSPVFWAAYGERTDGRDNDLAAYQPNYAAGDWGFRFSALHATNPGLCAASNPAWADWVQRLGLWIDNHMPRTTGVSPYGAQFDRFHPTVDFAYTGVAGHIRIGFWDSESPLSLDVEVNGVPVLQQSGLSNGEVMITDTGLVTTDVIKVTVTDPTGNRQIKEKTIRDLFDELRDR